MGNVFFCNLLEQKSPQRKAQHKLKYYKDPASEDIHEMHFFCNLLQ